MTPQQPDLVDVVERIVETIHLTGEHRDEGRRPPIHSCPVDPCFTWRRFLAGRLP